jgi:hypothetical protein
LSTEIEGWLAGAVAARRVNRQIAQVAMQA